MFLGTSISEAFGKDFERVLGGQNLWFSLFCRWFFEVIFGARIERSKNRKKLPTRELGEFFRGGSVSWRHGFGKAKKGVQQESVTVPHAQRPPSADAADLSGSAMPPTPCEKHGKSPKSRTKIQQISRKNRLKIEKKHLGAPRASPKAPRSVIKSVSPSLAQLSGSSWAALGMLPDCPGRVPECQMRARCNFFTIFSSIIFHITFWTDFLEIFCRFLVLRNLKNRAPVQARAGFLPNRHLHEKS